ncbi:hypothetical protein ACLKA6_003918 [Drosophila palustris]
MTTMVVQPLFLIHSVFQPPVRFQLKTLQRGYSSKRNRALHLQPKANHHNKQISIFQKDTKTQTTESWEKTHNIMIKRNQMRLL